MLKCISEVSYGCKSTCKHLMSQAIVSYNDPKLYRIGWVYVLDSMNEWNQETQI